MISVPYKTVVSETIRCKICSRSATMCWSILVVFILSVTFVSANDCPSNAVNTYLQCLHQAELVRMKTDQNRKQMQEEAEQRAVVCFTDSGCRVPKRLQQSKKTNSSENGPVDQCEQAIHQQIEHNLQSCVQSSAGLVIPIKTPACPPKSGGGRSKNKPKCGDKLKNSVKRWNGPKRKEITRACSKSSVGNAVNQVLQCLNVTFNELHQMTPLQPLNNFCSAKNSCLDSLESAGCNESDVYNALQQAETARCNCSQWQPMNMTTVAGGIAECDGVNVTYQGADPCAPRPDHPSTQRKEKQDPCDVFRVPPSTSKRGQSAELTNRI